MAWQCIKNKIGFFETSFLKCFSFFSKVKPYIKKYKFYSFQWHFTFNYFQRLIKANNHIFFSQYPVFALPFFFFLMFLSSLNVRYMYIYPQSLFTVKVRLSWTELSLWTQCCTQSIFGHTNTYIYCVLYWNWRAPTMD